jgi:hypothetical protein
MDWRDAVDDAVTVVDERSEGFREGVHARLGNVPCIFREPHAAHVPLHHYPRIRPLIYKTTKARINHTYAVIAGGVGRSHSITWVDSHPLSPWTPRHVLANSIQTECHPRNFASLHTLGTRSPGAC